MKKLEMLDRKSISDERNEKKRQADYLHNFLGKMFKGSNIKPKVEYELQCLYREIDLLNWVLKEDNLPF